MVNEENAPSLPLDRSPILAGARASGKVPKETMVNSGVNFRLTLLALLQEKHRPAEIARMTKKSKSAIHKAIAVLLKHGDIVDLKTWPRTYALSDRVNQFLTHPDKPQRSPLFDGHALMASWLINQVGNLPEGDIDMKNWSYYMEKFGDFSIQVVYGKENKLIVYPPKRFGDTSFEVAFKLGDISRQIVDFVRNKYKCEIKDDTLEIVRRPEFHPLNDPVLEQAARSGIDFQGKLFKMNGSGEAYADLVGPEAVATYEQVFIDFPRVKETLEQVRNTLMGSIATQNALANNQLMQTSILKLIAERENDLIDIIHQLHTRKVLRGHIITKRRGA